MIDVEDVMIVKLRLDLQCSVAILFQMYQKGLKRLDKSGILLDIQSILVRASPWHW